MQLINDAVQELDELLQANLREFRAKLNETSEDMEERDGQLEQRDQQLAEHMVQIEEGLVKEVRELHDRCDQLQRATMA